MDDRTCVKGRPRRARPPAAWMANAAGATSARVLFAATRDDSNRGVGQFPTDHKVREVRRVRRRQSPARPARVSMPQWSDPRPATRRRLVLVISIGKERDGVDAPEAHVSSEEDVCANLTGSPEQREVNR